MHLQRLQVDRLRVIDAARLDPGPGINWLVGANGSGKSSLLESLSLLATGRSFRGAGLETCVRRGSDRLTVFAEMVDAGDRVRRLGLSRLLRGGFEARLEGVPVPTLSELFRVFPAVVVPADSGALIAGPGEGRRRFLDWGLFHVEPRFLEIWQRHARALKQRNVALRHWQGHDNERAWREAVVEHGLSLHRMRRDYLGAMEPFVTGVCRWLLPALGAPRLVFKPGWPAEREALEAAMIRSLDTDRRMGFTGLGPHRAGWTLVFDALPAREMFSRGQAKLASMAMLLAQLEHFARARGEGPVVGLDDALAELDLANQDRLLDFLKSLRIQAFVAAADAQAVERLAADPDVVFHVEQGEVRRGL